MKKAAPYQAVKLLLFVLLCSLAIVPAAFATNGMNMEGYGPIATGMGGASFAYDNGTAAVMNNPATLGLMPEGNRLDVALGFLRPDITTSAPGFPDAKSDADFFTMPAIGWVQKKGAMAYGIGVFAQGGMGTEYGAGSFLAMGSGDKVRSELGVGRAIVPFTFDVNKDLTLAVSLDYVWASLDLQMALPGAQFGSLVTSCVGPACAGLPGFGAAPWVRLDFTGGGDMNGAARGTGYAGKLGAVYKINPDFSVGATYHSKTHLGDLETKDAGAVISVAGAGPVGTGKIKVIDFQWPETYGIGAAWNASKELMVVLDYKRINWNGVMKNFKMAYEGPLAGAPGNAVSFALPQNWKNQNVYEIGAAYKFTPEFTGRIGANISDNPIPDLWINYLFPATEKNHYTIGAGYAFDKANSVDLSYAYAPEVSTTNSMSGITTKHSQGNIQIMYSLLF